MGINDNPAPPTSVPSDFRGIVESYYQPLYRFAISLCRNDFEAQDLTQQTFFLWASRGHQLRDGSKVKSWLFTTLYREFLGIRKKNSRLEPASPEEFEKIADAPAPVQLEDFDGDGVLRALMKIEETYRTPLMLFYLKNHSYKQIAAVLNLPIGTVMSRLSRGKQQLKQILSEGPDGPEDLGALRKESR